MIAKALLALFAAFAFAANAPAGESPDAVVTALYRQHDKKSPFFQNKDRKLVDRYFAPALADLIWKDAHHPDGEVGALDWDPLYDSNDPQPMALAIQPAKIDGEKATVTATFANLGKKCRITFRLVSADGNWKISDIRWTKDRSLYALLEAAYGG